MGACCQALKYCRDVVLNRAAYEQCFYFDSRSIADQTNRALIAVALPLISSPET